MATPLCLYIDLYHLRGVRVENVEDSEGVFRESVIIPMRINGISKTQGEHPLFKANIFPSHNVGEKFFGCPQITNTVYEEMKEEGLVEPGGDRSKKCVWIAYPKYAKNNGKQ